MLKVHVCTKTELSRVGLELYELKPYVGEDIFLS